MVDEGNSRALVINTAFLGDVALTTPLLRLLAENGWTVDALVIPQTAELLADSPDIDQVLTYDKRRDRSLAGLKRRARSLRGRYDAVLVPHRSARSSLLALHSRTPLRVGYRPPRPPWPPGFADRRLRPRFTSLARLCFNRRVDYLLGRWEGLRTADLARGLGIEVPPDLDGRLGVKPADRRWAAAELNRLPRPLVVCFPGSVRPSKRYPAQSWAEVGWMLVHERNCGLFAAGSAAEREQVETLRSEVPGCRAAVDLNLGRLKALIAAADLVICNDSAPLHLAVCLSIPVVAVYGPTDPRFGFRAPAAHPHRYVRLEGLECRPCRLRPPKRCPLDHHNCLRQLPPETIAAAALELLDTP